MAPWRLRRQARFAFAVVATVAALACWIPPPSGRDLAGTLVLDAVAAACTLLAVLAVNAALRRDTTPEPLLLLLLFAGGIAVVVGLVSWNTRMLALGLATLAAGAACIDEGARRRSAATSTERDEA